MPTRHVISNLLPAGLCLCLVLLLAGCQTPGMGTRHVESTTSLTTADLLREADKAFEAKRWDTSELYYSRLGKRQDLTPEQTTTVFGRLTRSAVEAGHHNNGFMALSQWAASDHRVNDSADYFALGLEIYHRLGMRGELTQLTDRLLRDQSLPWAVRARGGVALASLLFEDGEPDKALNTLSGFYSLAPDQAGRAAMERTFLRRLRDEPWDPNLARLVTPGNVTRFPFALIAFEDARRQAEDETQWSRAWKTMRQVVADSELVDKAHMGDVLLGFEHENGQPTLSVAVAVPVTGRYGAVGRKIADGVAAAQWMLANYGVEVEVKVINTDAPGWTDRIASLPPHFAMAGGPLRVSAFKELQQSGALAGRAFLTFLPELAEGLEGSRAWRFFPSRRDEVRALAELAVGHLGIERVAILAPDEPYGRSMSALFRQEAAAQGASVVATQTYPPKGHPQWGRKVAELLQVPSDFDKDAPLEKAGFGAVFLPDGWNQAQLMIPNFFFYDQSDMVFLGPDLWSRALDAKGTSENYFELAVCPGAWWGGSPEATRLQEFMEREGLGKADFWVALGYDYLQLVAGMGVLPAGWNAAEVNSRLRGIGDMSFAMAPLSWDAQGKARQRLYLFSPNERGKVPASVEAIQLGVEQATAKRERRLELWEETQKAEAEAAAAKKQ